MWASGRTHLSLGKDVYEADYGFYPIRRPKVWPNYYAYKEELEPPSMIRQHTIWIVWPPLVKDSNNNATLGEGKARVYAEKPARLTKVTHNSDGTTHTKEYWDEPKEFLSEAQMKTRFGSDYNTDTVNFPRNNTPIQVTLHWVDEDR